jgi:hypothetical protein
MKIMCVASLTLYRHEERFAKSITTPEPSPLVVVGTNILLVLLQANREE